MNTLAFAIAGLVATITAILLVLLWHRWLLPWLVMRHTRKAMGFHRFTEPSIDDGAGTRDIHYLATTFDCTKRDLVIEGKAPSAPYWQIGVYDPWLRAISGGHINHRTVRLDANQNFKIRVSARDVVDSDTLFCRESPRGVLIFRTLLPNAPVATPVIRQEPTARQSVEEGAHGVVINESSRSL